MTDREGPVWHREQEGLSLMTAGGGAREGHIVVSRSEVRGPDASESFSSSRA